MSEEERESRGFNWMKIEDTYNIHKKINCIIPIFKSKFLCRLGIHNFQLFPQEDKTILKCRCCNKIKENDE